MKYMMMRFGFPMTKTQLWFLRIVGVMTTLVLAEFGSAFLTILSLGITFMLVIGDFVDGN